MKKILLFQKNTTFFQTYIFKNNPNDYLYFRLSILIGLTLSDLLSKLLNVCRLILLTEALTLNAVQKTKTNLDFPEGGEARRKTAVEENILFVCLFVVTASAPKNRGI